MAQEQKLRCPKGMKMATAIKIMGLSFSDKADRNFFQRTMAIAQHESVTRMKMAARDKFNPQPRSEPAPTPLEPQ